MLVFVILIFANCICDLTLAAIDETQQLSHERSIRQASNNNGTKTPVTDINIAFDLPDITAIIQFQSGSVQLEGFKSVRNDKIIDGKKTPQLFWVSIGHPHFIKTKNPTKSSEYQFFHSSDRGFTTYVQMMTEEQRKALATAARLKYRVDIADHQVVHLVLSKFYCNLLMYDEAGSRYMISGTVSDFRDFPLRMDFDINPGKIERILFTKLIKKSEIDLQFKCHIVSSGGKRIKSNTLSIRYEQSQQIGLEEKLFGPAGNSAPTEVYVSRNQMTDLAVEMFSTLNILEEYEMPESQFSEAFVNDFISQLATSQFTQTSIDTALASISKYSFDISADLKPDIIKRDFGSFLTVNETGGKSRITIHKKKYREVADKYSTSLSTEVDALGAFKASANAATEISNREVNAKETLDDQMRELNTRAHNEGQWEKVGEKIVPKSLNVARMMRSSMKKTLTFKRIRIQQFNAPFESNFNIYTSRASPLLCHPVSAPKAKVCPYGFDYLSEIDQCLYLNLELMNWDNARSACTRLKRGAQMVSIKDSVKQEAVRRYLQHQYTKQESAICYDNIWPRGEKISWLAGQTKVPNKCGSPYFWKPVGAVETPFNYTSWFPGYPHCLGAPQSCSIIASAPEFDYRWVHEHCDQVQHCSVCEF